MSVKTKRVLYFCSDIPVATRFMDDLAKQKALDCEVSRSGVVVRHEETRFDWVVERSVEETLECLKGRYINLLVIDIRCQVDDLEAQAARIESGLRLLSALDNPDDIEERYGFHRILVLTSGPDCARVDDLMLELGARGVMHVSRQRPFTRKRDQAYVRSVFDATVQIIEHREVGKAALAASGGGITGLYFELGALKCLDDVFAGNLNNLFDMFFGISAGAVVTSVLAAGFSADEFMAAIAGHEGGRIEPLDLSLFRLGHVNTPDIRRRVKAATRTGFGAARDAILGRDAPSLDAMFLDYTALVGPPFRSDHFEEMVRNVLKRAGVTNDFRALSRSLFIGASDQDSHKHVLFGSEGWDNVPISQAVQASMSIHPAFSAVRINGRYYEDGAVTRTSDFVEAINRGADLVIVLDPFVPYVSDQPGVANRRGILYNIDQDIRSLSYTRFANTRNWVLRKNPEVSVYTFLPANTLRQLLSVNPMDHRPYREIWRGAYLSTYYRIRRLAHRMRGDLHTHGIELEFDRAAAIVDRLEAIDRPRFSDFFVDGKVQIRQPELTFET